MGMKEYYEELQRQAAQAAQPTPVAPPEKGLLEDMYGQFKLGLVGQGSKQLGALGQAVSPVGSSFYEAAKEFRQVGESALADPENAPSKRNTEGIRGVLTSGASGVGQMAPIIAAGLLTRSPVAAASAAGILYGGSTYQETKEKDLAKYGLDDAYAAAHPEDPRVQEAKQIGAISGAVQGTGDALSTFVGGKLIKGVAPAILKRSAADIAKSYVAPKALQNFLKAWGIEAVTEGATEAIQDEAQAAAERSYNIPGTPQFGEQAGQSFEGGFGTALLLGPLTAVGTKAHAKFKTNQAALLANPEADVNERLRAATIVAADIAKDDPNAAMIFVERAEDAIRNPRPYALQLDESVFTPLAELEKIQDAEAAKAQTEAMVPTTPTEQQLSPEDAAKAQEAATPEQQENEKLTEYQTRHANITEQITAINDQLSHPDTVQNMNADQVKQLKSQLAVLKSAQKAAQDNADAIAKVQEERAKAAEEAANSAVPSAVPPVTFAGQDVTTIQSPNGGAVTHHFTSGTEQGGSEYVLTNDGYVRRNKGEHKNTGGTDSGLKSWNSNVLFLEDGVPANAPPAFNTTAHTAMSKLFENFGKNNVHIQFDGNSANALVYDGSQWRQATWGDAFQKSAKQLGIDSVPLNAKASDKPAVGLNVLDYSVNDNGGVTAIHNGSPVTSVTPVNQQQPTGVPEVQAASSNQSLSEETKPLQPAVEQKRGAELQGAEITGFNDRFSRSEPAQATGAKAAQVQKWLGNIPNVIVLDDFTELFANEKDQNAEAVARRSTGKIYVNASKMKSAQHAKDIVFDHELRHFGLSKMFGGAASLAKEMEKAFKGREAEVIAFAMQRGYTRSVAEATEEYIVSKAKEAKEQGFLGRVVAGIRGWARANGFGSLSYSNAEILKMIRESGEVVGVGSDISGDDRFAAAWHGTPHTFDKFSTSAIGTGEGAQAYGYGLYFAGNKEVAEWYREMLRPSLALSERVSVNGQNVRELPNAPSGIPMAKALTALDTAKDVSGALDIIKNAPWANTDNGVKVQEVAMRFLESIPKYAKVEVQDKPPGRLYKVELAPAEDEYLLWDKPLSEQSEKVKAALKDIGGFTKSFHGKELESYGGASIYNMLTKAIEGGYFDKGLEKRGIEKANPRAAASEYLHSLGIRGIKYLDGNSRSGKKEDYNYVVFDEQDVEITDRFSRPETKQEIDAIFTIANEQFKTSVTKAKRPKGGIHIERIADLFGKPVVWYNSDENFRGFGAPGGRTIFLNADSRNPVLQVLGHELSHKLYQDDPAAYAALEEYTLARTDKGDFAEYTSLMTDRALAKVEFVGDVVGGAFAKKDFWLEFEAKEPTLFARVLSAVRAVLKRAADFASNFSDAGTIVAELDSVDKIIAQTFAQYAKDQQDRFSRGERNDFTTRVLEEARRADEGSLLSDATNELARVLGPEFYNRPSATARATKAAERSFLRKWAAQRGLIQDPTEFNAKWTTELDEEGKPIQGNEHDVTFSGDVVTKRNRMPNNYHESYAELFDRVAIFNWLFSEQSRLTFTGFQEVDGVLMPVFTQKIMRGGPARIEETQNFLSEAFEPVGSKTASFRLKGSDIVVTDVFGNNTRKVGNQVVPMDYVVFHGKRAEEYLANQEAQQREINESLDEEEFNKQFDKLTAGDRFSRPFNKQEAMDEIKSYGPSMKRFLQKFISWIQPLNRRYDSLQYTEYLTDDIKAVVRDMAEQSGMQRSEQNRVLSTTKEATDQWMKAGKDGNDLFESMALAQDASLLQLYPGKSMVEQGWGDTPEAARKAWNKAVGVKHGRDFATEYSRLTKEFNALSPATRKAYLGAVDVMANLREQLTAAYMDMIETMPIEEAKKRTMRTGVERRFRNLKGAFMPFTRHGEYVANVYNKADGTLHNSVRAASMGELRAQVELLKAKYPAAQYDIRKFDGRVIHKAKENRISPALLAQMKEMLVDNLNQAGFSKVHKLAKKFLEDNVEQLSDDQRDLVKAIYKAGNLKSQAAAINALRDNVIDSYELVDLMNTMDSARETLKDNPGLTKAIDDLEQIFLDTLPDTSALKSSMHRKGTAGWNRDSIRSVLDYANRYGKSLAYMKHGRLVDQLEAQASKMAEAIPDPEKSLTAQTVLKDTFENRRVVSEEEVGALGKMSTKLGSLWFLTSPSMMLVQNSQPWAITVPYLAARYGLKAAVDAMFRNHVSYQFGQKFTDDKINTFDADLKRAPKDWNTNLSFSLSRFYASANGETKAKILKSLTAEEKDMLALRLGMDSGVIANSMSFEAVEYARKGASGQIGTALDTAAEKAYYFQRVGETLSRKGAYMAAFELATKNGDSFDEANRKAIHAVNETLYDYSATNRPRIISGTFGRFFGQFRTYQLQTIGHIANLGMRMARGDAMAKKELGLLLATNFVLAGATGLPMAGSIATLLGALGFLMGEDDEWVKEIEEEMMKTKVGQVALKGAPMLLGLDLSRRIGMEGLTKVFQGDAPAKATPKDRMNFYAAQILGPAYTATAGAVFNMDQAIQDGDWGKAFEQGTPRAIASALQAMKLNNKGLTDSSGRVIIPEDQISKWDVALMMVGVNPGHVSIAREKERNVRDVTDMMDLKKQRLAKDLERAVLDSDGAGLEKAQAAIQRFNQQYPMFGFTSQSLASRLRGAWQERAGITSRKYQAAELYLDRYDEEEEV